MDQLTKKKLENAQKLVDHTGKCFCVHVTKCQECPADNILCNDTIGKVENSKILELAKQYIKDHKETE